MVLKTINPMSTQSTNEDPFAKLIGQFGKWQFILFSSLIVVKLSSGWVQLAIIFLTPNAEYWCANFENNSSIIEVQNSTCYESCVEYAYDTSPFENTVVSEWDLVCGRRWLASFTQMVLQLGILVGSFVFGFLSDRYGRKNAFLVSVTALIIFGFAIPYSPTYTIFTSLRFFQGVAVAGTMVISFVIVMESVGPKYREVLGCLYHVPFNIGHLTLPLFSYYFRNWNTYSLALALPPLIYFMYFFILTESPRWLVSIGRVEEATKIVTKIAEMNSLPTNNIQSGLTKLSQDIRTKADEPKCNYIDLFKKPLRLKTISFAYVWFVVGIFYFGFNQYISQTSQNTFISTTTAGAVGIPSIISSIWWIRLLGRKNAVITFFVLGGISIFALGFVQDTFWISLTLGSIGVSCASIVATSIYIFASESYPTVVRNMGIGVCSMSMRVGSMIAPFISTLSANGVWLPTAIFSITPISAALVCLLLEDTKGKKLPDRIEDA